VGKSTRFKKSEVATLTFASLQQRWQYLKGDDEMALDENTRAKVRQIFEDFLRRRINTVQRIRLKDFNINPFLFRLLSEQMGLNDARSILKFLLHERFERGAVTSAGDMFQKLAAIFCEPTGVEGADLLKRKEGRYYYIYIQVKAGPNTVDKDACIKLSRDLRSAQRRHPGSITVFGMAYGSEEQVSNIVRSYLDVDMKLIGKDFWAFISDDPDCLVELYEIAGEVARTFRDKKGRTIAQLLQDKLEQLVKEFEVTYGSGGDEMWQQLLQRGW
jgi:hypothetical protein